MTSSSASFFNRPIVAIRFHRSSQSQSSQCVDDPEWQGNRNPFVDKPDLVAVVFASDGETAAPVTAESPSPPASAAVSTLAPMPWINEVGFFPGPKFCPYYCNGIDAFGFKFDPYITSDEKVFRWSRRQGRF